MATPPLTVAEIARSLMSIDSTTGSETGVIAAMSALLESRGWPVIRIPVTSGRDCLLARSHADPDVTLSTHLDTVPPYLPPILEGDRLSGRGACDAKGIAAAMMAAADRLVESGEERVDLLFVVGEEKGSDGARAANHLPATSRYLINGEPTDSRLASGAKGSQRVIVRTRGREAHSAYPHLGQSAIEPLLELLPTVSRLPLPTDPILGDTTVNIGVIRGGTEANIIPGECEAELMFRLVGDVSSVRATIEAWARDRAEIKIGRAHV